MQNLDCCIFTVWYCYFYDKKKNDRSSIKQTKNTDHVCPHTFVSLNVPKRPKVCADIAAVCYRPLKQSSTFLSDRPGRLKILFRFTVMDMITDTCFSVYLHHVLMKSTHCFFSVFPLQRYETVCVTVQLVLLKCVCVCRAGPFKCLRKQIQLLN